jgi:P27 family predicted phage terminase small subunit
MAGRRPLPTAVRQEQGESATRGRGHSRPIEGDDFQPDQTVPEMPKHLGKVGRREWNFMSRVLAEHGVITEVDRQSLATYCEAVDAKEEAQKQLKLTGGRVIATYMEKDGERLFLKMDTNPWWKVWREAVVVEKAYLIEFGLTPASRSRLKLPTKKKETELEKLMARRKNRVGFQAPAALPPAAPDGPVNKA